MDAKLKRMAIVFAILLVGAVSAWFWLPRVVDALPGQIRGRLPEDFLALVTTPLPTALPAPLEAADSTFLEGPVLTTTTLTSTPTAQPTMTETSSRPMSRASASATPTRPTATPRPSPSPTASPTPTPLPDAVRIEGLKNTPQKYNNCGPANLSIVLRFYGHEVDQLEIGEALKPNYDDRNVSPHELVNYVHETSDQEAMVLFGLDLEQLKALLSAQFPVIVEKGLDLSDTHGWMGHYLTLFGYDQEEQVFMGLDTFLGPWDSVGRDFEFDALEMLWAQFNRATIIVYPAERKEELEAILGPQMLDERSMWIAAAEQAQEALNADAQDAFAWFDLGASLYHLAALGGDDALYMRAAATFDRAREIGLPWRTLWYQFEPYQAYMAAGRIDEVLALTEAVMTTSGGRNIEETYLYRGHALLAGGDQVAAERAYERALRLNPGLDAARDALQTLANSTARGSG